MCKSVGYSKARDFAFATGLLGRHTTKRAVERTAVIPIKSSSIVRIYSPCLGQRMRNSFTNYCHGINAFSRQGIIRTAQLSQYQNKIG